jgi:hypothetical protein
MGGRQDPEVLFAGPLYYRLTVSGAYMLAVLVKLVRRLLSVEWKGRREHLSVPFYFMRVTTFACGKRLFIW